MITGRWGKPSDVLLDLVGTTLPWSMKHRALLSSFGVRRMLFERKSFNWR
jgi:hypothetical protein